LLLLSGWLLSAPAAASVSVCRCRSCLPPPLPPLLSAGAIANVAATATAAPVPSAVIAATAAYFSAAVNTASMFQRFRLPLCFDIFAAAAAAASVLIAIATIVLAYRSFGASGGRWQRTPWSSRMGSKGSILDNFSILD
jgi:hypothetical protein